MKRAPARDAAAASRRRTLERIERALKAKRPIPHPGTLDVVEPPDDPVEAFSRRFSANGGEVFRLGAEREPGRWLGEFLDALDPAVESVVVGADVPPELRPTRVATVAADAGAGVSLARGAVAETGSVVLAAAGTRAVQTLPAVHVAWVPVGRIVPLLSDAFALLYGGSDSGARAPECLALHSGPSKSADIAQTVVTGVHGPGRCVAVLVDSVPGEG